LGAGYATDALRVICRYAFEEMATHDMDDLGLR
jgi:RimJ/RimL family protein N-acetyltransferase